MSTSLDFRCPFFTYNSQVGFQDSIYNERASQEHSGTSDPPPVPHLNGFEHGTEKPFYTDLRQPSEASLDNTITGRSETTSPSRRKPS